MTVRSDLVPVHLLLALASAAAAAATWFPSTGAMLIVLTVFVAAFVLRLLARREAGLGAGGWVASSVALGALLVPSLLVLVSVPLSVRGPEGAGSLVDGLPWLASWDATAFVLALFVLPLCAVAAVWQLQDGPRRVVFLVGAAFWIATFLLAPSLWVGEVPGGDGVAAKMALVAARIALFVLAFGFVYALKATPDLRTDRAAALRSLE